MQLSQSLRARTFVCCSPIHAPLRPLLALQAGAKRRGSARSPRRSYSLQVSASASSEGSSDPLAGQVSEAVIAEMKAKITAALGAESVNIIDVYGDGRHVSIDVVASSFEGLTSVKRQQAVYKAIWLELQNTVHAVDAMTTKTPAEAS